MKTYLQKIVAFLRDEEGAAAIEYALLLVMVAIVIIAAGSAIGPAVKKIFEDTGTGLTGAS